MSQDFTQADQLDSVICGFCEGRGIVPPGASAPPGTRCPECAPYGADPYNLPPGRKPLSWALGHGTTDWERSARALLRSLPDEPTFTYDPHRTRARTSWHDWPAIVVDQIDRWSHAGVPRRAITRPGDRPHRFGVYTRGLMQNLAPDRISGAMRRHYQLKELRRQAYEIQLREEKRARQRRREADLRAVRRAQLQFYVICVVFVLVVVGGFVLVNLFEN